MEEKWRTVTDREKTIYPTDEKEQETALANDEMLADFKALRKAGESDFLRPIYHFTRPDSYLNDPNGLCYWRGKWHLFYQANGGRIHWGHAVSDDLIHWRDLPFAIYPEIEDHCFSGGTVVDIENDRVIAAYYGYTGYGDDGYRCGTVIATSSDPLLLNWTKVNGSNPIIPDKDAPCWRAPDAPPVAGQKPYQVFDSYIWMENGEYFLLTAGYTPNPSTGRRFRQMYLFRCRDKGLTNWEYLKPFLKNDRFSEVGDDGACPYFLDLGEKHLMLHFSHRGVPKYIIGDYDRESHEFYPVSGGRITSGNGVIVAPSAYALGDGSAVGLYNTAEQLSHGNTYGCMTIPRRFRVGGYWKDELYVEPFCDYSSAYTETKKNENFPLPNGEKVVLDSVSGTSYELSLEISPDKIPDTLEIEVLRSKDGTETTKIAFFKEQGGMYAILPRTTDSVFMIDTSNSSVSKEVTLQPPEVMSYSKERDEKLKIRIFVDRSIVEVFVCDRASLVRRPYPMLPDSTGIAITAHSKSTDSCIEKLFFGKLGNVFD